MSSLLSLSLTERLGSDLLSGCGHVFLLGLSPRRSQLLDSALPTGAKCWLQGGGLVSA